MLYAYMDDSGTHEGSHSCVIAGYFGGVNRWKEFERRWKDVLDRNAVDEFHAREFWKHTAGGEGTGKYRGWSRKKRREFMEELLGVIGCTEIYPFASGVLRSEWMRLTVRERKILCGGKPPNLASVSANPIFLPFQQCVARSAIYCKPGIRIHFVFDDDKKTSAWAPSCYQQLKALVTEEGHPEIENILGDLTFADSKIAMPLQAADLLAYEAYKYAQKANENKSQKIHPVYARALKRMRDRDDFWLFDRPRLQSIIPRSLDESQS